MEHSIHEMLKFKLFRKNCWFLKKYIFRFLQITKNLFLYSAPAQAVQSGGTRTVANPKVNVNYVFVRTQNSVGGSNSVVVPPPKQKTLVYVLNQRAGAQSQQVIEVPSAPVKPEVFFVNYDQGDDTQLPGGVSLQQALSQSQQQGQVIGGGGFSSGGGFSPGGGFSTGGGGFSSGGFSSGGISSGGFSSGGISSGGFSSGGNYGK